MTDLVNLGAVPTVPTDLDSEIRRLAELTASAYLRLGKCLLAMKETEGWVGLGFPSWEAYIDARFGRKIRWVQYLLRTATKTEGLSRLQAAAPALGASKVRIIADAATPETEEKLIGWGRRLSCRDLEAKVRAAREAGDEGVDPPMETPMSRFFSLFPGQKATVDKALEMAAAASGSSKTGNLLEMICAEFVATYSQDEEADRVAWRARLREVIRYLAEEDPQAVVPVLEAAGWKTISSVDELLAAGDTLGARGTLVALRVLAVPDTPERPSPVHEAVEAGE